jgi:hypothetical protein
MHCVCRKKAGVPWVELTYLATDFGTRTPREHVAHLLNPRMTVRQCATAFGVERTTYHTK